MPRAVTAGGSEKSEIAIVSVPSKNRNAPAVHQARVRLRTRRASSEDIDRGSADDAYKALLQGAQAKQDGFVIRLR